MKITSVQRNIAITAASIFGISFAALSLPSMAEGARNSCHALEKKAVASLVSLTQREDGVDLNEGFGTIFLTVMNAAVEQSGGSLARAKAQQVTTALPADVTCSARWWVASLGGGDALANEIRDSIANVFDEADFDF
jgi:hypothetical protein